MAGLHIVLFPTCALDPEGGRAIDFGKGSCTGAAKPPEYIKKEILIYFNVAFHPLSYLHDGTWVSWPVFVMISLLQIFLNYTANFFPIESNSFYQAFYEVDLLYFNVEYAMIDLLKFGVEMLGLHLQLDALSHQS